MRIPEELKTSPQCSRLIFDKTEEISPFGIVGTRLIFADKAKDDPKIESWEIVWEKVKQGAKLTDKPVRE